MTSDQIIGITRELLDLAASGEAGPVRISITPYATKVLEDPPAYEIEVERAHGMGEENARFFGTDYRLESTTTVKP